MATFAPLQALSSFTFEKELRGTAKTIVYVASKDGERCAVKILNRATYSVSDLRGFSREYNFLRSFNCDHIVKAVARTSDMEGVAVLAMEHVEGSDLRSHLEVYGPLSIDDVLAVGIGVATALDHIHRERHVIHCDVNPSNIVYNFATKKATLIDFGAAQGFTEQVDQPAFTIQYMSVEQTGRMDLDLDYRTDLYSLGATLYHLSTGELPTRASTHMDYMTSHLLQPVRSAHTIRADIPIPLSNLMSLLLEKDRTKRYQSAFGVAADLAEMRARIQAHDTTPMRLGASDRPFMLTPPGTLYGRDEELSILEQCYGACLNSKTMQIAMISGGSGIGKSALLYHFFQRNTAAGGESLSDSALDTSVTTLTSYTGTDDTNPTALAPVPVRKRYHLAGKFDLYARAQPYAGFKQCFVDLLFSLTRLPRLEQETVVWAITQRCGKALGAFIQLVPVFESLFGKYDVEELPPAESAARLQAAVIGVITAFSSLGVPLVMFLDDLQWMDPASAELLESLIMKRAPMLLVGAFRDTEVGPSHPLGLMLGRVKGAVMPVNMQLKLLSEEHVAEYVADCLHREIEDVTSLATVVHARCGGDPFFLRQFMQTAFEKKLLWFDNAARTWCFDLEGVVEMDCTDNVVDFCIANLRTAEPDVQRALSCAALIGSAFTAEHVDFMCGPSSGGSVNSEEALLKAVLRSFIRTQGAGFKFVQDRIQEAALALLPEEERPVLHFKIATLLAEQLDEEEAAKTEGANTEENLLQALMSHVVQCRDELAVWEERAGVAARCLEAGLRAKRSCGYRSAQTYFTLGRDLLNSRMAEIAEKGVDAGADDEALRVRRLQKQLLFALSEIEYLCSDFARSEELFQEACQLVESMLDHVELHRLRVKLLGGLQKYDEVLVFGLDLLKKLGLELELHPKPEALQALHHEVNTALEHGIPDVTKGVRADAEREMIAGVCVDLVSFAFLARNFSLYFALNMHCVLLSLRGRIASVMPWAIGLYGFTCTWFPGFEGNQRRGTDLCLEAIRLADSVGDALNLGRTYMYAGLTCQWKVRPSIVLGYLAKAFYWNRDGHDPNYVQYTAAIYITGALYCGVNLNLVLEQHKVYAAFLTELAATNMLDMMLSVAICAAELVGIDPTPYVTREWVVEMETQPTRFPLGMTVFYIYRMLMRYLRHDFDAAMDYAPKLDAVKLAVAGLPSSYDCVFVVGLVSIGYLNDLRLRRKAAGGKPEPEDVAEREEDAKQRAAATLKQLEDWAVLGPGPFEPRLAIMKGEYERLAGNTMSALNWFHRAQRTSQAGECVHVAAFAAECAVEALLETGLEDLILEEAARARNFYRMWGATTKVDELNTRFPSLISSFPSSMAGSVGAATPTAPAALAGTVDQSLNAQLTFAALLKSANVITSAVKFDDLKLQLATTIFENVGGTRLVLLVCNGPDVSAEGHLVDASSDALRVVAEAVFTGEEIERVSHDQPYAEYIELPRTILDDCIANLEPVLVNDVARSKVVGDAYFAVHPVESLLCHPIVHGSEFVGLVYVEHATMKNVYAPKHVEVVKLLLSNVAGALVNARLYARLQEHAATLETTNAMLVKSLKVRDVILSNTSHELRTPLHGILGLSDSIMLAKDLPPRINEKVSVINACARSLLSLVNDILDMAKLQQSQILLNCEDVNARQLVAEVFEVTRFLIRKPVKLVNEVALDVPPLFADRMRIRQVFFNIIGNAVKFTARGTITVTSDYAPGSPYVVIGVRDTGIGIASSQLDLIFEPFSQLDDGAARKYGGSGLGLSISRSLMELHGGTIAVKSVEGEGSTFFLTFPVNIKRSPTNSARSVEVRTPGPDGAEEDAMSNMNSTAMLSLADARAASRDSQSSRMGLAASQQSRDLSFANDLRPRVLVVDDNAVNLMVIEEMMSNSMDVTCCDNAMEALRLLKAPGADYELVLLDWMMPVMDGIECCKEIRKFASLCDLPVIFLTAKSQAESVATGFGAGGSDYLVKPVDRLELLARSRALIDLHRAHEAFDPRAVRSVLAEGGVAPNAKAGVTSFGRADRVCLCLRLFITQPGAARTVGEGDEESESESSSSSSPSSPMADSEQPPRRARKHRSFSHSASPGGAVRASRHPRRSSTQVDVLCAVDEEAATERRGRRSPSEWRKSLALPLLASVVAFGERALPRMYSLARIEEGALSVYYLVHPLSHRDDVVAALGGQNAELFEQEVREQWRTSVKLTVGVARSSVVAGYLGNRRRVGVVEGTCFQEARAAAVLHPTSRNNSSD